MSLESTPSVAFEPLSLSAGPLARERTGAGKHARALGLQTRPERAIALGA
jgi:hypothetical protein